MEILQAVVLILVGVAGFGVVKSREPLTQAIVFSFYGLILAIMFVLFQAPAVAFSQIAVGSVALPLLLLIALTRVRRKSK
jgi:energy-converting hydrogenase B subunit D